MSYWTNKKVLVTGGAGFIGSHLVRRLSDEGATVAALDNLQSGRWENLGPVLSKTLQCLQADVRDVRAMRDIVRNVQPAVVLHLAANASVPGSVTDPEYDFGSNAMGSFHVLDAVRHERPDARVVIASSAAVYGEPTHFPITEDSELAPISPYGASKLAAETEARMFHAVYKLPVVIARLFNTYGPGMPRFVILDFLRKLQKDPARLEILGTGRQMRDFNHVDDTVAGILALAERGVSGESYNIAAGLSHSVTDLAHILIDVLGLTGKTTLSFTGESWAGDAQRWEVDIAKVKSLDYEPKVPLREGVALVAEWFNALPPTNVAPICDRQYETNSLASHRMQSEGS